MGIKNYIASFFRENDVGLPEEYVQIDFSYIRGKIDELKVLSLEGISMARKEIESNVSSLPERIYNGIPKILDEIKNCSRLCNILGGCDTHNLPDSLLNLAITNYLLDHPGQWNKRV